MELTVENIHGEKIIVKLEKGKIMVKHTDISDKFMSLNHMFRHYVLEAEELLTISKASQMLNLGSKYPQLQENIKDLYKH